MNWKSISKGLIVFCIGFIVGWLVGWNPSFKSINGTVISGSWIVLAFLGGLLGGSDILGFISNHFKEKKDEKIREREKKEMILLDHSRKAVEANLIFRVESYIELSYTECDLCIQVQNLNPTTTEYNRYNEDVNDHLKYGYPEVWDIITKRVLLINQHDAKAKQSVINLKSKIMNELKQRIPDIPYWDEVGEPPRQYYTKNFLNQIVCSVIWFYEHPIDIGRLSNEFIVVLRNNRWQIDRNYPLIGSDNKDEIQDINQMIIDILDNFLRSEDFNKLKECFENVKENHRLFKKKINNIIILVKNNIPLEYECEIEKKAIEYGST
jgi:hypothetical protein